MELSQGLLGLVSGVKEFQKIVGKDKIKRLKKMEQSVAGIKYKMQQDHVPESDIEKQLGKILAKKYPDYATLKSEFTRMHHANNQFEGNEGAPSKNTKLL